MSKPPHPAIGRLLFRGRPALAGALVAILAGSGCARSGPRPAPPDAPDVLVIVLDAVRADRLSSAGYARRTTPRLDELAASGVRFEHAFAAATWTKPSIASLFTSRHPSEHGLLDLDLATGGGIRALDATLPVVAESFQAGGWATIGVVNQVHLSPANGFGRGFETYRHLRAKRAKALNGAFLEALDAIGDRPYFGYLHYLDAHWPYERVPKELARKVGRGRLAVEPPNGLEAAQRWQEKHLDAEALAGLESRYDGEIRTLDGYLGRLFDQLRQRGRWENTIVVVTSDHGESFAERGRLQHGHAPYVEEACVPLLVKSPERFGFPPGVRQSPVGHVDLAPTLLELAGAAPLKGARGRSLRALLAGQELPSAEALTQSESAWALRVANFSFLAFTDGHTELYDRASDPGERRPLDPTVWLEPSRELGSRLRRLRSELQLAVKLVPQRELTAEELQELRALGYL